ncbi:hypothetical protein [Limosilactobacillus vaginalis]|uniref:hypothetical protein n=1 Tax=Limosilactobacillus vaginalis TaxID=1633 RepID=UPI00288A1637|nr:hypothetical protein [Limosilactobacillus vaginalis]
MDCITPMLSEALNSIDDWGDMDDKIDHLLSPNDWRLQEIIKFRKRIALAEKSREQHDITAIRKELARRKLTDKQCQTEFLYQHGLSAGKITEIIDIARSTADKIILEYRASHYIDRRKAMGMTDALVLMKAE